MTKKPRLCRHCKDPILNMPPAAKWCNKPECREARLVYRKTYMSVKNQARKQVTQNKSYRNERKETNKSKGNNLCIKCGKDKGANRYWCKACHARITQEAGNIEGSAVYGGDSARLSEMSLMVSSGVWGKQ